MNQNTKPVVTKTARGLVEKAIRAMRKHPQTVNMKDWIEHDDRMKGKEPYCGTEACIAGHLALAAGAPQTAVFFHAEEVKPQYRKYATAPEYPGLMISPGEFVERVFGIRDPSGGVSVIGGRLFYKENWPVEFLKPYNAAKRDHKTRARVTIARLRYWLKTGK